MVPEDGEPLGIDNGTIREIPWAVPVSRPFEHNGGYLWIAGLMVVLDACTSIHSGRNVHIVAHRVDLYRWFVIWWC